MSSTVLYMSMSLDGFIAGPDDGPGNGLGDGGDRLHAWLFEGGAAAPTESGVPARPPGVNGEVFAEMRSSGAVLSGRRTFEIANGWGGDHHDGVPIFVLSRRPPSEAAAEWPLVSFVEEIETAAARAKEAAGGRNVLVHGATTAQLALAAGVLDEIQIHLVPVLLGGGRSLFDQLGSDVELERAAVIPGPGVTHMRYRVAR